LVKLLLRKALTVAVVTMAVGWFYGWASPWAFPLKGRPPASATGMLHGALMPLSLPSLVIGKDVPIYERGQFRAHLQDRLHLRRQPLRPRLFRPAVLAAKTRARPLTKTSRDKFQ
jgi:hypothetical protein